jgi:hypothetical protein
MDELQIKVTQSIGSIDINLAEIESNLKLKLADYEGLVISNEDEVAPAKKDIADLKKNITVIENERKRIKKIWNEPYEKFEADCKKLVALINDTIAPIQQQIDEFDVKRIADKKVHLNQLYSENIKDFADYLPFEGTLTAKWQNKTFTDKDYLYDLSEKMVRVRSDLDVIKSLQSEIESELLKAYKDSGNNLSAAIKRNQQYVSDKQRVAEQVKEQVKEEVRKEVEETVKNEEIVLEKPAPIKQFEDFQKMITMVHFVVSLEDAEKVEQFLKFSEIAYRKE